MTQLYRLLGTAERIQEGDEYDAGGGWWTDGPPDWRPVGRDRVGRLVLPPGAEERVLYRRPMWGRDDRDAPEARRRHIRGRRRDGERTRREARTRRAALAVMAVAALFLSAAAAVALL
jgi:hypothetical protein